MTTTMVAVVTNEVGLRDGRLPQPRREGAEVVAVGHSRQAGEDVPHIGHRVFPMTLARDDQRVEVGGALTSVGVSDINSQFLTLCSAEHNANNWMFIGHPNDGDRSAIIY